MEPGWANSDRIKKLKAVPIKPAQTPNIKYKVPISLWLVEYSQRAAQLPVLLEITEDIFVK